MAKTRILTSVFFFVSALVGISLLYSARSASCDAIVGKWAWFVGGEVTINPDGTFAQQSGNGGSWECTDAAQGRFTLRWRQGGYVNRLALSADGKGLSSADPTQQFVTAKRVGTGASVQPKQDASALPASSALMMSTQTDGSRLLPKDLPELMHAATKRARLWRQDATPVGIEINQYDAPNHKGPEVRFRFTSPSTGIGYQITVSTNAVRTFEFNQAVNWGELSLPPVFVDLPAVARIARGNGMKGPIGKASLRIYAPKGVAPVLAWMVHPAATGYGRTLNGATGEIIEYDVTGYIAAYNKQWEHAAKGLRALMRSGQRGASSNGSPTIGSDSGYPSSGSDRPYDDGSATRAEDERRAAESRAYWGGSAEDYNRIKNGECTWSSASKFGC